MMIQVMTVIRLVRAVLLLTVVSVIWSVVSVGQAECWTDGSVAIHVGGTSSPLIAFGVAPTGTDCFDVGLDQNPPPPPPTQDRTDAWFVLPGGCPVNPGGANLLRDIRASAACGQGRRWLLHVQDRGAATLVTLSWIPPALSGGSCAIGLWLERWPATFNPGTGEYDLNTTGVPLARVDMLTATEFSYAKSGVFDHSGFTITLVCEAPNMPPTANADVATTNEDTAVAVSVLANDTDPNPGDILVVVSATDPLHGTTALSGTGILYTPDPQYCGADSFHYTVGDGHGNTDEALVNVTVVCQPDSPVAIDDAATIDEDSEVTIHVLANDYDPDVGSTLTVVSVGVASHGTALITGGGTTVLYTPSAQFCGPDLFSYTVSDGTGRTDVGMVSITVACVNDAPVAADDAFTVVMNSALNVLDVLANDSDPDPGDTLSIVTVGPPPPPGGCPAVTIVGNRLQFSPCPRFTGQVTLTYIVRDQLGATASATVVITVILVDPIFRSNLETGVKGWVKSGAWKVVTNTGCCSGMPSPTHAWNYSYAGGTRRVSSSITTPWFPVAKLNTVTLSFWQSLSIGAARGITTQIDVSFGRAWINIWKSTADTGGTWTQEVLGPIAVPATAKKMRVRFLLASVRGAGSVCWCIDDITVWPPITVLASSEENAQPMAEEASEDAFEVYSVSNMPNPVTDVHTTRFEVKGIGIEEILVQIFDLSGQLVFDSGWEPNGYDWHVESDAGETLANGVYLYIVSVRGADGSTVVTETQKLVVYR